MGRIKTTLTKRTTKELVEMHGKDLKKSFAENKPLVNKYTNVSSKKMRNIIAGYVTRLIKREQ